MAGEVQNHSVQTYNASLRADKRITLGGDSSGTSTAVNATTMTDGAATWTTNQWAGKTVYSLGKSAVVSSNTATVLTFASWTGGTPATGTYIIGSATCAGPIGTSIVLTANPGTGNGHYVARIVIGSVNVGLTSADGGSVSLGVTGANTLLIGASTATSLTGLWMDTTPNITTGKAVPAACKNIFVAGTNILLAVTTGAITAGQLDFTVYYDPLSSGGMYLS